jgi:DNA-binding LacI/PurR family transcriptional regulator
MNPTLTTVDTSTKLIAEIITDFLIKRMVNGDRNGPKEVSIPGKLIIRDSSTRMKLNG